MKIGVAGLGFMGASHLKGWRSVEGANVAAVMSSSPQKLSGDLSDVGGNLSMTPERFDFTGVSKYTTFEQLLSDPQLDVIDICLPTHMHVASATAALRAGKHVFLEKPIALESGQALELVREAESNGRKLMVGHVLRFFPAYAAAAKLLKTDGPVRSAFFRRRCAAPGWSTWISDLSKSGGAILDLLIHDIDYCISLWGVPDSVRCAGFEDLQIGLDTVFAELRYKSLGPVIVTGGFHHPKAYPFAMEFTISTDKATLDWKVGGEMKQYSASGEEQTVALDEEDPFGAELKYFAHCITNDVAPERCPPQESAEAVAVAEMLRESRKRGGEEILCKR